MLFEEEDAEVCFDLRIPNFSTYRDFDQTFTSEFPLKVNNFSSRWSLTLYLSVTENGMDRKDPINRDIRIVLKCVSCNVSKPKVEVYSHVVGKEQHVTQLTNVRDDHLTWTGILISQLGLKVFNLLTGDQLTAKIRFVVKKCDMTRAVGGVEGLSKDMRVLLESGTYSDADVITSDGTKLPVHLAVLSRRSNLLQNIAVAKKRQLASAVTPDKKMVKAEMVNSEDESKYKKHYELHIKAETPINSTFGSMSSGYQSSSSRVSSPEPNRQQSASKNRIGCSSSSRTGNRHPPDRRGSVTPRKPTPHKIEHMSTAASPIRVLSIVNNERSSPHGRVQMKNSPSSFRRTPVPSHPPTPKRITSGIYDLTPARSPRLSRSVSPTKKTGSSTRLSITKRTLPGRRCSVGRRSLLRTPSPNKRLKTPISLPSPKISSSKMQQLRRTPAIGTPSPRRRLYWDDDKDVLILEDLRPLASPVTGLRAGSLKNESTEPDNILELEQQSQRPKIFVNMSASVTRAILEWIYTGECTETASLSRALLVGSIRHDVTGLARSCEYHLAADLTPVNAPELIFLAHKYSALKLKELALAFAVQEAAEVTAQPMWSNLAVRVPGVIAEYSRRLATRATSVAKK